MGGWIALRFAIDYPGALRTLTLMNNAGILGADESELQKLAANRDYNPLVIANLEDADRLIAAHALALDLTLVTNNERDFADVPGLRIENWTR